MSKASCVVLSLALSGCAARPASSSTVAARPASSSTVAARPASSSTVAARPAEPHHALTWDPSQSVLERRILGDESSSNLPWDERITRLLVEQPGDVVVTAVGDLIGNRKTSDLPESDHRNLVRILREADIGFANLEMTIHAQKTGSDGVYDFGVAPEFAWEIANLGINLVSLANNHSMDFGGAALADCMRALDRADILHAGAGMTRNEARDPAVVRVQNQVGRFALLSYVRFWRPLDPDPDKPSRATINPATIAVERPGGRVEEIEGLQAAELSKLQDDIVLAKRHYPFVMVTIHAHDLSHSRAYGQPHPVPDNDLIMYHQAIDAGADVVFTHGPHVVRGIQMYKGKPIFYSLGNFMYHYRRPERRPIDLVHQRNSEVERPTNGSVFDRRDSPEQMEGILARLTINQARIRRIEVIPFSIDREGPEFGTPRLPKDDRGNQILDRVQKLSEPFKTKLTRHGWYAEVALGSETAR